MMNCANARTDRQASKQRNVDWSEKKKEGGKEEKREPSSTDKRGRKRPTGM